MNKFILMAGLVISSVFFTIAEEEVEEVVALALR